MTNSIKAPEFGPLAGVKVVHATMSTAGPFANEMLAEMGADVVWIESPLSPDVNRAGSSMAAESERRNQKNICLNIPSKEGRNVLLTLLEDADIFMETSKGGQYERWGLTDEILWEVNPKLVIVHISGFGQTGDPGFIARASFDPIAQAFSGYLQLNGYPDLPPVPAAPLTSDYLTGLTASTAALAALLRARETGEGESIDIAQYEIAFRCQAQRAMEYFNLGIEPPREGARNARAAGWGMYECKDGKYVYMLFLGCAVLKKGLPILGIEYGTPEFPEGQTLIFRTTPAGKKLEEKILELCKSHTAKEVENLLWPSGVPCCRVMDYDDIQEHPHYVARGSIVEWTSVDGRKLRGAGPIPRFKNNPTQIWRGCPGIGMDNENILKDAGFSEEEITGLYEKKILHKVPVEVLTAEEIKSQFSDK